MRSGGGDDCDDLRRECRVSVAIRDMDWRERESSGFGCAARIYSAYFSVLKVLHSQLRRDLVGCGES